MEGGFTKDSGKRWKREEQAMFVFRLGELLQSGYYLPEALRFLQSQESDKRKSTIEMAIIMLKEGHTLYEVLSFLKFHHQLLQFVYYAEYYGDLPHALLEGGRFWQKRNHDRDQFIKVFMYPLLLFIFIIAIVILLQGMLLPKFQSLYENMNIAPTFFLKLIITISSISHLFPYMLVMLFACCYLVKKFLFDKCCPLKKKSFLLKIPLLKGNLRIFDTYFLAYQLSGLLSGGLSINDSIHLFSKHTHHPFFQKIGEVIYTELNEGKSLEEIFQRLPYFDPFLVDVLANGQKNGKLDKELHHYSRILLQTIENRITSFIKIIQPLLLTTVGFIVISVYLSVLLPMFSIIEKL